MSEKINSFSGMYGFLSNFHKLHVPIYDDHRLAYYSVENAYQATKSMDVADRRIIKDLTPAKAKIAGRKVPLRQDWEIVDRLVMLDYLVQKFLHNPDLMLALHKTGNAVLEEGNHWGDTYWGTVNGRGDNHLGRLLMQVRDLLG